MTKTLKVRVTELEEQVKSICGAREGFAEEMECMRECFEKIGTKLYLLEKSIAKPSLKVRVGKFFRLFWK